MSQSHLCYHYTIRQRRGEIWEVGAERQGRIRIFSGLAPALRASDNDSMLIHSVYFWLKPELSEGQRASFLAGLESLRGIKSVTSLYIGTPAPIPDRPVVDRSYSFALTIVFKDVEAHNAYQVDPLHKAFVETNKVHWNKVQIYDAC